jgi:hypothetical protein
MQPEVADWNRGRGRDCWPRLFGEALKPALLAIPGGGLGEALSGVGLRAPQRRGWEPLWFDHPVAVREIRRSVDRELRFIATQKLVGAGCETQENSGLGDHRRLGSDCLG